MEIAGKKVGFRGRFPSDLDPVKFELLQLGARYTDDARDAAVDLVVVADPGAAPAGQARARGLAVVSLRELVDHLVTVAPAGRVPNLRRALRAKQGPDSPAKLARALHEADPADGVGLAGLLRDALDNDVVVELTEGAAPADAPVAPWLLAWCSDADGCACFAVPGAEAERAGLAAIRGACFADGSDVAPAALGVLIRVLAGLEHVGTREPAALARGLYDGWRAELAGRDAEAGLASAEDLVPWIGWLAPFRLSTLAEVERPFTAIVAVNQAM